MYWFVSTLLFLTAADFLTSLIIPSGIAFTEPAAYVHFKLNVVNIFSLLITAIYAIFVAIKIRKILKS